MEKLETFVKNYWSYYLRLEAKFLATLNYVEFDAHNFKTYSFEYLNLLLSVCSEIDVVGKMMAHEKNPDYKPDDKKNNINKWWVEIQDAFQTGGKSLTEQEVKFFDTATLTPWKKFRIEITTNKNGHKGVRLVQSPKAETPAWWRIHNNIKHNRTNKIDTTGKANYTEANLINVANAFAGLYVLEHSFMKSIGTETEDELKLVGRSKLFEKEGRLICNVKEGIFKVDDKEVIS